ncbi:MAG TPA: ComEC/Rec2 family competence protein [Patescibacteria group bacterium]|nr:ComEC/Rec2 family competence protein [Patescibacteria group bacterium]
MEINRAKVILVSLVLIIGLIWSAILSLPDNQLHLVFCDVGQGDATLIYQGSNQILIDGGPDQRVLSCLSHYLPFWDREIEMVIATHPESDHITGLIDVIERYKVKQFVINSVGKDSAVFQEFQAAVLAEKAAVYFPKAGDRIEINSLVLSFLWPRTQEKVLGVSTEREVNDTSLVFELAYGQFEALLTGDISTKVESQLSLEDIEVLKVAHHGSKYSTDKKFLKESHPELAIVSVGKNSFGHPTSEVIERLSQAGVKLLRTDQEGEIEVVSNGETWYTQ